MHKELPLARPAPFTLPHLYALSIDTSIQAGFPSPAVERALAIIGSLFAIMGFALGAVASYGAAHRMSLGLACSLLCARLGGVMGAGLGFVIPRIVLAVLLVA